jgi:hypothetical protein
MPRERITDEMIAKFNIQHNERPREAPRWRDGSHGWYLIPVRTQERSRALECTPEEWETVKRLSRDGGLHLYDGDPFTTDRVRQLRRAVSAAVQKNPLTNPQMKDWVDRFLAFLGGDGATGFVLSREWRRVNGR